jgi:Xaa-Pro aminopeptidase
MKIAQLQEFLRREKIDAALFVNLEHKEDAAILYFTQIRVDLGALLVPANGKPVLLIPGFEYDRIKKIAPCAVEPAVPVFESIKKKLSGLKRVGVTGDVFSIAEQRLLGSGTEFVDIGEHLAVLRTQKTPAEQKLIAESCAIACKILNEFIPTLPTFKTEEAAARELARKTAEAGCTLAFPPIVASGANGATPHHIPHGKLNKGFCVIDFGVRWKGYCSDITRTVFLGKPTAADRKWYGLVLRVQEKALGKLRPGADHTRIDAQARKDFGAHKKNFVHRLGHSVGLRVHDSTPRAMSEKAVMREGMVWTVEPGLYFPGKLGIRIEDTALVTKTGNSVLTAGTPKKFRAVSA